MTTETGFSVERCHDLGKRVLERRTKKKRKKEGQYLTPPPVARHMASLLLGGASGNAALLEPALGSGVLAAAAIEEAARRGHVSRLHLVGYETDAELLDAAKAGLESAAEAAAESGLEVRTTLRNEDFVLAHLEGRSPTLFEANGSRANGASAADSRGDGAAVPPSAGNQYDYVLANPPYFKLKRGDPRRQAAEGFSATSNIYPVFMELCERLLTEESGRACFIVPRSFCSGTYFGKFRRYITRRARPERIHLFESRADAFKGDAVLQENVIFSFRAGEGGAIPNPEKEEVVISTSKGVADLGSAHRERSFQLSQVLGGKPHRPVFRLPTSELDGTIISAVDAWPASFDAHGLNISTGPVVPFRSRDALRDELEPEASVPLLWLHNVTPHRVDAGARRNGKEAAISTEADGKNLLPAANYVLMRRFAAKEEKRRMVAGPFLKERFEHEQVGFENHLNYIYREDGSGATVGLDADEARGLSALLGSALMDRYFRVLSGHTQINATDLRATPMPPLDAIREIGRNVPGAATPEELPQVNRAVYDVLRSRELLPPDLPRISETRIDMEKVQEAQEALKALGLPKQQQNDISALTLLVLAQLSPDTPWSKAQRQSLGITEIMDEMAERYDRRYAPNTRETVRRRVIHQFVDAGVAVRNPDDPTLPTNSPNTHYGLSDAAIRAIRKYGSDEWEEAAQAFLEGKRQLIQRHRQRLEKHRVPLTLPSGEEYSLSPGAHNELQAAILNDFGPEFAPGAKVLYVGDTADKTLHVETEALEALGFDLTQHDKLPDVVLYDEDGGRLLLVEAVTSHGPVDDLRISHIEQMIQGSDAEHIYVTAFPDFGVFKNYMSEIAWETEVWLADTPEHMIHFNGDRFLR